MSKELNELIQGLGKLVDGYKNTAEELDKLKSLYEKLKLETAEEFEYPFVENENYFTVSLYGDVVSSMWNNHIFDTTRYSQGNAFKTKQEAERERDKRALLTRFRQFRDKRNGDWKPFEGDTQFYLNWDTTTNVITINCVYFNKSFALFGYFKNKADAERAIELFGDEIKRLWVDE